MNAQEWCSLTCYSTLNVPTVSPCFHIFFYCKKICTKTLDSLDSGGLSLGSTVLPSDHSFIYLIKIRTVAPICEDTCHQASMTWVSESPSHGLDQVITALNLIIAWSVQVGLLSCSCLLEVLWFTVCLQQSLTHDLFLIISTSSPSRCNSHRLVVQFRPHPRCRPKFPRVPKCDVALARVNQFREKASRKVSLPRLQL